MLCAVLPGTRVTHSITLPEAPPPSGLLPTAATATGEAPPPAAVAAAETAGAGAGAAAAVGSGHKRAAAGPLEGAKQRFKRLLDTLACRRRAELGKVDSGSRL